MYRAKESQRVLRMIDIDAAGSLESHAEEVQLSSGSVSPVLGKR